MRDPDAPSTRLEVALGLVLLPFVWAWDLLRWAFRGLRRAVEAVAVAAGLVASAVGRVLARALRVVREPLARLARKVLDALLPLAVPLGRWVAALGRAVGAVLRPPLRWAADAVHVVGGWVDAAYAAVARLLRRPLQWAAAVVRLFAVPARWVRTAVLAPARRARDAVRRAGQRLLAAVPRPRLRGRRSE